MYLETDNKLVGHVPMELFFLIFTFLKARCENKGKVKETGKQTLLSLDPSLPERPAEQSAQPGAGGGERLDIQFAVLKIIVTDFSELQ